MSMARRFALHNHSISLTYYITPTVQCCKSSGQCIECKHVKRQFYPAGCLSSGVKQRCYKQNKHTTDGTQIAAGKTKIWRVMFGAVGQAQTQSATKGHTHLSKRQPAGFLFLRQMQQASVQKGALLRLHAVAAVRGTCVKEDLLGRPRRLELHWRSALAHLSKLQGQLVASQDACRISGRCLASYHWCDMLTTVHIAAELHQCYSSLLLCPVTGVRPSFQRTLYSTGQMPPECLYWNTSALASCMVAWYCCLATVMFLLSLLGAVCGLISACFLAAQQTGIEQGPTRRKKFAALHPNYVLAPTKDRLLTFCLCHLQRPRAALGAWPAIGCWGGVCRVGPGTCKDPGCVDCWCVNARALARMLHLLLEQVHMKVKGRQACQHCTLKCKACSAVGTRSLYSCALRKPGVTKHAGTAEKLRTSSYAGLRPEPFMCVLKL